MDLLFEKYKAIYKFELQEMIFSLYKEDPEGEPININKINNTIETLQKYPEKGKIMMFIKGKKIVGYSILINYWSNEYGGDILHIDELFVKEEFRGKGYSKQFFSFMFNEYKAYKAIMLEVTPSNKRAFQYYKNLGFEKTTNKDMIKKCN